MPGAVSQRASSKRMTNGFMSLDLVLHNGALLRLEMLQVLSMLRVHFGAIGRGRDCIMGGKRGWLRRERKRVIQRQQKSNSCWVWAKLSSALMAMLWMGCVDCGVERAGSASFWVWSWSKMLREDRRGEGRGKS